MFASVLNSDGRDFPLVDKEDDGPGCGFINAASHQRLLCCKADGFLVLFVGLTQILLADNFFSCSLLPVYFGLTSLLGSSLGPDD